MEPEVLLSVNKSPQLDSVLSQMNPVHILTPCSLKISFNVILPCTRNSHK
jgi:hypothetical protein